MSFSTLGLADFLLKTLESNKYEKPYPIQEEAIPAILKKKDVLGIAQTGSGKTASYVLPILTNLQKKTKVENRHIEVLVLVPTRELTLQIAQTFENFGEFLDETPKIVSIIGGESIGDQLFAIQKGCDILVATSGRFLDVLSKKQMNLSNLKYLVLDEADKMLNFGFSEELNLILQAIPDSRQNLLFSATYPQKILDIASKITQNWTEVSNEEEILTVDSVTQRAIEVNRENRGPLLRHLLDVHKFEQVLVFMANKRATDNISAKFQKYGYKCESFNGDLSQEDRTYTLDGYKDKKIQILFATDIAARGLDIDDISCVINFDLPRSPTDYIHRIGRTARAGKSGIAISFISNEDKAHFKIIEKKCNIKINREQIEGFELSGDTQKNEKGKAPVKGKGKSKKDKLREKALLESK